MWALETIVAKNAEADAAGRAAREAAKKDWQKSRANLLPQVVVIVEEEITGVPA